MGISPKLALHGACFRINYQFGTVLLLSSLVFSYMWALQLVIEMKTIYFHRSPSPTLFGNNFRPPFANYLQVHPPFEMGCGFKPHPSINIMMSLCIDIFERCGTHIFLMIPFWLEMVLDKTTEAILIWNIINLLFQWLTQVLIHQSGDREAP